METNSVEAPLDANLDIGKSLENILEDDDKATRDGNDTRVTDAKNVITVEVKKPVSDGTVLKEPEPDATIVVAGNIPIEFKTNVKAEEEVGESASLKTLKLNTIAKLEKLIHVRKVGYNVDNAIMID